MSDGGDGGTTPSQEYRIWIENPLPMSIHYKLNGTSFTVDGNHTRWHSYQGDPVFNVEFDCSFDPGYQRRGYRLMPGSRNYWVRSGNALDLLRR